MSGRLTDWLKGGALYFVLEIALVVTLGAAAAHWTWALVAPAAIGAPGPAASRTPTPADDAIARRLLGAPAGGAVEAGSGAKLRLVGVFAPAAGEPGRAVFVLEDGKSKAARSGESIVPGTLLREVHPDHVLIERDGAPERLRLERRAAGRPPQPGAARNGIR